jgi:hypothetical protein
MRGQLVNDLVMVLSMYAVADHVCQDVNQGVDNIFAMLANAQAIEDGDECVRAVFFRLPSCGLRGGRRVLNLLPELKTMPPHHLPQPRLADLEFALELEVIGALGDALT